MNSRVLKFLEKSRVCVFTTLLKDGSPHSAAMHYSHKSDPFVIYVSTDKSTRKCQAIMDSESVKASVVVGFSEEDWISLQLDGEASVVGVKELPAAQKIHYSKHPNSAKYKDDPGSILIAFTPKWWRYTDGDTISSED